MKPKKLFYHSIKPEMAREICAAYEAGEEVAAIANRHDVSPSAIYLHLQKAGVPLRSRARTMAMDDAPRVSRDPCPYCGVRGDIGCRHRIAA